MFEQQHFIDLQDNGGFADPKLWLSGEDHSSPSRSSHPHHRGPVASGSNGSGGNSNFDRLLYKNLVEMVPLVESLMDRRSNASYTRRASLIYTKTPSRESYPTKVSESKGRKAAQSIPAIKRGDAGVNSQAKHAFNDEFTHFTSNAVAEKDKEMLVILQEQVEDLQNKLLEKDELLKLAETSMSQMSLLNAKLDELKCQVAEKDTLIKSINMQISDGKIKLADKQAVLEKLQWEAATSNRKVEKLQEDLDSMHGEVSAFMLLLEKLTSYNSTIYPGDYDAIPYNLDPIPYIDEMDEIMMQQMEEAREAYFAAVAVAKETQDEEPLAMAAEARLRLQSLLLNH